MKLLIPLLYFLSLATSVLFASAHAQELNKTVDLSYSSPILVRKGDVEITLADFVAYMDRRVPKEDQRELLASASRIEGILENIALTEAFWLRGQESGLTDDVFFRARLYQAAAREARNAYREKLQREIELDSYEAQARELYLLNPERFSRARKVTMEHILVSVGETRGEIDGMKRVIEAYERLQSGEDFVSVAESYSDDPTFPQNNGLLVDLEVDSLVPSVASAVDSLELGKYSSPIQSRFGWHIIRLNEIQDAGQMSWEEAQSIAERIAREEHLTEAFERILREVNAPPMQFAPGAVEAVFDHYGVEGFGIPELGEESASGATPQ